jgi:RNA polymerase sigma-70 factor (sigma-E family)
MNADAEAQFSEFVAARQQALLRTAYLLTSELHSAEDLVQISLAKAYLAWDRLRDPRAVEAYVRKIMVNEHTSWWRRAWRRNERSTDEVPESPSVEDDPAAFERRDAMWELVQTLPPKQRAAVVLRYYEDLSEAETARILGCSIGTVKSQTHRALGALRTRLEEQSQATKGEAA